ncbi:MarR family winged helix-turn-helix transcriptional regulator [Terrabacter carboxydivorans]|uniref:HTH marR-type domain-containing protein n=1 Tax=Terrabacter carboxydivorans TaxID=619730 RepID=A0ABN3KQR1_9MICO
MSSPEASRDAATAALRELILVGERYRIAVASHLGLTVNESRAISHLLARGAMGQTELATALGLTTSSTTTLVDRLEERGMVTRVPDPHDRRRSSVEIPASGVRRLRDVRDWMPHAFDDIGPDELPDVAGMLETLASSLREVTSDIEAARTPTPGRRKRS